LDEIINAYNEISASTPIVLPLHPRTRKILNNRSDIQPDKKRIIILPPVSYWNILWLLNQADLVITDSGGMQKEAYFSQKSCIITRDETEWTELVEAGINIVTSANTARITKAYLDLIDKNFNAPLDIYGNGNTSEKIVEYFLNTS
jgi:UDP-GlcNAc3NAcA epimerase